MFAAVPTVVAMTSPNALSKSRNLVLNLKARLHISPRTSPVSPEPLPHQSPAPEQPKRRRVQFAERSQVHRSDQLPASCMSEELKAVFWYQENDYEFFKDNAHCIARGIRERHRADPSNPRSYSNVLSQTYTACVHQIEPPVAALAKWLSIGYTQRGLEMMCVKSVKDERRYRTRDTIRAIVEEFKRGGVGDGLRAFAEERTKPAKLFASAIAQADFLCLQSDAQFKPAADIYQEYNHEGRADNNTLPAPNTKTIITQRKSPHIPYGAKRA